MIFVTVLLLYSWAPPLFASILYQIALVGDEGSYKSSNIVCCSLISPGSSNLLACWSEVLPSSVWEEPAAAYSSAS